MANTYRYTETVQVHKEDDVTLEVKFVSNGNLGVTNINVPGSLDPTIVNAGTAFIGKGKDLMSEDTIIVSKLSNPNVHEEDISLQYYINDKAVLAEPHSNKKSDTREPMIILILKFEEA